VLAWGIKMVLTERLVLVRTPLDGPLLLFLGYGFVRALTCAAPNVALREVGWLTAYVAIFYVAVNTLRTRRQQGVAAGAIVTTAVLLTLLAVVLALHPSTKNLTLTLERPKVYHDRFGASYVCPNHYAGYLEMAIPLLLGYVILSKARLVPKIVASVLGLGLVMGIIFSMSRGGWISLTMGLIFLLVAAATQKKINVLAWILPPIVILVTAVAIIARDPRVRDRFARVADKEDVSYGGRAQAWKYTLDLVQRHPVFGTGPGTYRWAFTAVQPPSLPLDVRFAHNDYLQTLSDYGVIGLGLVLWGVGVFGFRGIRALRRLKRSNDLALATAVMGSAVAIAAHSFVDFNMRIPANLITMLVLAALLLAIRQYQLRRFAEWAIFRRRGNKRLSLLTKVVVIAALGLAAVALLAVNARKHEARIAYHRGRELDMSLVRPMALKERTLRALRQLDGVSAEQIEPVVKAVSELENPMIRDVGRAVALALREASSKGLLEPAQADAVTKATRRARGVTPEEAEQIVGWYRRAIRFDNSNFEYHAALLSFYCWKGANSVLRKDVALKALSRAIPYGDRAFGQNRLAARVAFDMGETYKWMYSILKADDPFGLVDRSRYDAPNFYNEQARNWYERAIRLHPESGWFREGYGQFLEWAGDLDAALAQYEKGIEIFADAPWRQEELRPRIRRVEKKLEGRQETEPVEPDTTAAPEETEGPTPAPDNE
jgi:O-antigen ligase